MSNETDTTNNLESLEAPDLEVPDLIVSDFAKRLETAVKKLRTKVKNRGINAFEHLRKAWAIWPVDQSMAAFRAITAEEEAASALILTLRDKGYPHADRLDPWRHDHKVSVFALFQVISKCFAKWDYAPDVRLFDKDDPPRFRIKIDMNKLAGLDGPPCFIESVLPLDFTNSGSAGTKTFVKEFGEFASEKGFSDTQKFIRAEANLRNRILYASDAGIPKVEIPRGFICNRKDRVLALLSVVVMVEQTNELQRFVLQGLAALLQVLPKLDQGDIVFPDSSITARQYLFVQNSPQFRKMEIIRDGQSMVGHYEYNVSAEFEYRWLNPWVVEVQAEHGLSIPIE